MRSRIISTSTLALVLLALTILAATPAAMTSESALTGSSTPGNLIANESFERGVYSPTNNPTAWEGRRAERGTGSAFIWDDAVAHKGSKSAKIRSLSPSYGAWVQTLTVQPEAFYILSGWIKTENLSGVGALSTSGANLSILETSARSQARFGTTDWTYVSLRFNSGQYSQLTVAAQTGDPSGNGFVTGAAWFDDLQLTRFDSAGPHPRWKILALIYDRTDFRHTDSAGVEHHWVASMTQDEKERAISAVTQFVERDIPALTGGNQVPVLTIRFPGRPLTYLESFSGGWWPSRGVTGVDLDPGYDSVIVIWDPRCIDQNTGRYEWIGNAAGLAAPMGTGQAYTAIIIEAAISYGHRNVFKHEWGHCILFYYDADGSAPKPAVENHAYVGQYVHWPTGEGYVWLDETDANPIPNSLYNNDSGFTHDYYSGTVATADQPSRRLGITPTAWAMGGPVSKPWRHPTPPDPDDVVLYASEAPVKAGNWQVIEDSTAAGGARIWNEDRGAPKVIPALPDPTDYFEMTFNASAGTPYHLWVRGKAQDDSTLNDAVYVQFSDTINSSGEASYRIRTTSYISVILEDCDGSGVQGWGWQDNGWCGKGVDIYFANSGEHTIRVQPRQDGLSIDQIVLSPEKYVSTAPGGLKNDPTTLSEYRGGVKLFGDNFNSGNIDMTKWRVAVMSGSQDSSISLGQEDGHLRIGPLHRDMTGSHYNGIVSANAYDMTGAYAQVQAVKVPAGYTSSYMMLTLVADHMNHYRIYTTGHRLDFERKVGGTKIVGWNSAFDPVEDAFWRIRHDEAADEIVFETAPDVWGAPGPWRVHFRTPREVPVSSMRVELKAGTSGPQTFLPGTAIFDNVRIGR